nr:hypothetical protein [Tanacetum cinerariifolium]
MTKQECEYMIYDELNKFTSDPRESTHSYDMRFAKLINDINMIPMSMIPMQINTKQSHGYAGNAGNNQASGTWVINAVQNIGANQPMDKMLLAQAQEARVVLDEEKQDFLADNCDDEATTNVIFMANFSHIGSLNDDMIAPRYDSDTLSEVRHYDTYHDFDVLNSNIQELGYMEISWEQSDIKSAFKADVIPFFENLKETFKLFEKGFITEVKEMKDIFEQIEDEVDKCSVVIPKVVEKNNLSKEVTSHLTTKKIIEKCTKVLAPSLLKIETESINAYFKNNKDVHRDYFKVTKERVATLQELLEEARALNPLDERIGKVSSTNASGSKPKSNTKNDRIPQPSSRSMKNKVEAHHRKFKPSANKNNHVSDCNANVNNVALLKNSDTICLSCNECLFSTNYDACVV